MLGWLKQFFKDKPNLGVNPQLPKPAALTDAERRKLEEEKNNLLDVLQPHVYKIYLHDGEIDKMVDWLQKVKQKSDKGDARLSKSVFGSYMLVYGNEADWNIKRAELVQNYNEICGKLGYEKV